MSKIKVGIGIFLIVIAFVGLPQSAASSVIYIDGQKYSDGETKETAIGASLSFEYSKSHGEISWVTDSPEEIGFSEPNSRKTMVYVKKYSARNPEVALLRDDNVVLASVNLAIVDNTLPRIKVRYDLILSNKDFEVDFCGSTSGTKGDEDGDYIAEIKAVLKNTGGIIDSASRRMDEGDVLKPLTLAAGNAGEHVLIATVTDSYGEVAARSIIVIVSPSGSKKDDPIIRVNSKNGSIVCEAGKVCRIDTSGSRAAVIRFYQGRELLGTMNGGGIFERIFNNSVDLGIVGNYLDNRGGLDSSRKTETTVTVRVVDNATAETGAGKPKSSPGIGLLVASICVVACRKIRKKALA